MGGALGTSWSSLLILRLGSLRTREVAWLAQGQNYLGSWREILAGHRVWGKGKGEGGRRGEWRQDFTSDSPEELRFSLKSHSVGSSNQNANSKYNSYEVCSRNPFSWVCVQLLRLFHWSLYSPQIEKRRDYFSGAEIWVSFLFNLPLWTLSALLEFFKVSIHNFYKN